MTETDSAGETAHPGEPARAPFPLVRLLYALGFAIVAWFVFWIAILLAAVQYVVVAINGRTNDELKQFSHNLIQYLWELLAFIGFVRDEMPFPMGPFPKQS